MKPVGIAWIGTVSSFALAEFVQLWIGLLAAILTCIYTGMKIYDWVLSKTRKDLKPRGTGEGKLPAEAPPEKAQS